MMVVATVVLTVGHAATGDRNDTRVNLPDLFGVQVPPDWRGFQCFSTKPNATNAAEAVASFSVGITRDTCESGLPSILNFPRDGVFVFVWENLRPSLRELARIPNRPTRFQLATGGNVRQLCDGPSDTFAFRDAGRVFEVSAYFGPASGAALRARAAAMLDSLTVAPND